MTSMHRPAPLLASFRRHASAGIWLFVLLLGLVAAERRLAEAHYNLRSAAAGLERQDSLDGDEIRVRLVVLNDETPPVLPTVEAAVVCVLLAAVAPCFHRVALGRPAPRGPPRSARATV
jgi:hypothetical protein